MYEHSRRSLDHVVVELRVVLPVCSHCMEENDDELRHVIL